MLQSTLPITFESRDNLAVQMDPANEDWLSVVRTMDGPQYKVLARRYYEALYHFRRRPRRSSLPGIVKIAAPTRQQALEGFLEVIEERKVRRKEGGNDAPEMFVDSSLDKTDETLPRSLRDPRFPPLPLEVSLNRPGRPPCDALCLMRAFIAAPILGVNDSPTSVWRLLHSNPTFAHFCGFLGRGATKNPDELTSRRLPSGATCEEFSEVMTRYGLWHLARLQQVRENIKEGVVETETTLSFDTTHVVANSHCANVLPPESEANGKKPKYRKVPRAQKACACGKENWESCEHPWTSTDQGAAIVVKGPTRVHWAHKASIATLGDSEVPVDIRTLSYAAEHDGNTLIPHLKALRQELPEVLGGVQHILADDAYRANRDAVSIEVEGARLTVPIHPRHVSRTLAEAFAGIHHFTDTGVPVCDAGFFFRLWGRDLAEERYIWAAPNSDGHSPVCASCPLASPCTAGKRRHIRVDQADLPQISWDHPEHFVHNRNLYSKRTGVERSIKRIKVDLLGSHLGHRDSMRVQAHFDRKLLALHLLLAVKAQT